MFKTLMNPIRGLFPDTHKAQSTISDYGKYLQPFYDSGTQALKSYGDISQRMAQDPTAYYNQIMSGFTQSPYEKYQMDLLQQHVGQAAAAGGMLGTPNEQYTLAKDIEPIAAQSQQQYFQNVMQPLQYGLHGLSDMGHLGFGAAQQYGSMLSNIGSLQSGDEYAPWQFLSGLAGTAAGAAAHGAF